MSEKGQSPTERSKNDAPKLVPFGKYLLVERVAVGGMAEVWLSKIVGKEGVSDLLAIKRILPRLSEDAEFVRMFVDEARIAGALDHPGIARMHELGRIQTSFYIAMDYVWGRDLLAILRRAKELSRVIPPVVSAYIGARMCDALHYAHTKLDKAGKPLGLVHRDVSPQNVLISFDGRVKLIDFGIAKATTRRSQTQVGTLKGKVGYMSPEQVCGLPIDARSDQFALGTCLYELLSGRPLFMRGNNLEAMRRVRDADVPPLLERAPFCPPALAEVVMRALSKDPGARYASTDDMRSALLVVLADMRVTFERTELAEWVRDLFKEDFVRERARLDAMDLIGRPAVTALKKHRNTATELQIGSVDLFDDDSEEATEVWELPEMETKEGPYEVFFHRDGLVGTGPGPKKDAAPSAVPNASDETFADGELDAETLEKMRSVAVADAIEASRVTPAQVEPAAVAFEAVKPADIDSAVIRGLVQAEAPKPARGESTESVRVERDRERARGRGNLGTRRKARAELGFFGLGAFLMLVVGIVGTYLVLTTSSASRVTVYAIPDVSAQLLLDGQPSGTTPLSLDEVAPGRHVLTLVAPGFDVATREITVARASEMSVEITLERQSP